MVTQQIVVHIGFPPEDKDLIEKFRASIEKNGDTQYKVWERFMLAYLDQSKTDSDE